MATMLLSGIDQVTLEDIAQILDRKNVRLEVGEGRSICTL
jgi:hypothetical protein